MRLNCYEELLEVANRVNIDVYEVPFQHVDGLIKHHTIGIRKSIETTNRKADILCEELAHAAVTVGNILDQSVADNRRQEIRARRLAHNIRVGIDGLIRAYEAECTSRYEIAEYLGVSEEFLEEAIDGYRSKYGCYVERDGYIVTFVPQLEIKKCPSN